MRHTGFEPVQLLWKRSMLYPLNINVAWHAVEFYRAKRMKLEFNQQYFLGYAGLANRYRKAISVFHPNFYEIETGVKEFESLLPYLR